MSSDDAVIGKATTSNGSSSARGNRPPTFSGDRSEYRNFIAKAELYLRMHKDKYATPDDKIYFVISYLEKEVWEWAEAWLAGKKKDDSTKEPILGTFEDFKKDLRETYEPLNLEVAAMDKLFKLRQGTSPAEEFITQFKLLAWQAGLTISPTTPEDDPSDKQLREHFQRAMNPSLLDQIAIEPTPPTNLWSWFDTTLKRNLTWRTHKSCRELFGKKPPDRKALAGRSISIRSTIAPHRQTHPEGKGVPYQEQWMLQMLQARPLFLRMHQSPIIPKEAGRTLRGSPTNLSRNIPQPRFEPWWLT
jgi:hypothetical protein